MHTKLFAVVALVLAQSVSASAPNLIANGGFESSTYSNPSDLYETFAAGSTALTSWTIDFGSVDLIKSYWTPAQGSYSLDLSGDQDGMISQSFNTTIDQRYLVSFAMAGNPDDTNHPNKTMEVGLSLGDYYTFNTTGKTHSDMGWVQNSFEFKATGTLSELYFLSANEYNSPYGVALDNITVTAIPEPESFAMFLAGLGLIAAVARRRAGLSK